MDKFIAFADRVSETVKEIKESGHPDRAILVGLNSLITRAFDAVAQEMDEGRVHPRLLPTLETKYQELSEKWFVMPQLGMGNDLNAGSGGGDGSWNGLPAIPGMKPQKNDVPGGAKDGAPPPTVESIKSYVDEMLTEDAADFDISKLGKDSSGKDCKCGEPGCNCTECAECQG